MSSFGIFKFFSSCLGHANDYVVVRASFLINSSESKEIHCIVPTDSSVV